MRAPKNEAIGTSGQSFVKAEFEELGWGAVLNPEHDLGTDLWLMARDKNRFDLGALLGAQVKTGNSYFKSVKKDEGSGEIVGWWYMEEDDSHFHYWSQHATPHILVLRDATTKTSYWVHVISETILSTGKGNKIFVPISQTVDESSRDALTSVATSSSRAVSFDGSAWAFSQTVQRSDRLRYALMAPRLVAPHPNKGRVIPDAIEAIAMLMQGRFVDLRDVTSPAKRKEVDGVADPVSYAWKLFDAISDWAQSGDLKKLNALPQTKNGCYIAATTAVRAAALIEAFRPEEALAAVRAALTQDGLGKVDAAWLKSHAARCLVELGRLEEARKLALDVQKLRAVAPNDPTATALVAVTTTLVFDMSGVFGAREIGELIQSIDTSTRWWRSQTIASGLQKHFDEQFNNWARDSSVTWAAVDTSWTSLRSSTLLAGLSADHSGWRHTMSLLARRKLMKATSTDNSVIFESLTDLFRAGAKKELVLAVRKLSDDGPTEPLVNLVDRLDLESTPRSSLDSALVILRYAGDFANTANADRHAIWLISSLENPDELRERLKLRFLIEIAMLESLSGLMLSISPAVRRKVINHLLSLPAVKDQRLASSYGRIVALVGNDCWSERDLSCLSARTDDNWELQDDIDGVLSVNSPDFKVGLLANIKQGDLGALGSFGRVTNLPEDVAEAVIVHLVKRIESQVERAKNGTYSLGGPDLGEALVVLNSWHPGVAQWNGIEVLLSEQNSHPGHILGALDSLGKLAKQLPDTEKELFKHILEGIIERPAYDRTTAFIPPNSSPQSSAKLALYRIFPGETLDSIMQDLLTGSTSDREVAAIIAGERAQLGDRNLLFSLARDPEPQVRVAAIVGLAKWAANEDVFLEIGLMVRELVELGGPLTAKQVSWSLLDTPESKARDTLLQSLVDHSSALVRARVAAGTRQ